MQTTSCAQCGCKFGIDRDRCPKCRAKVVRVDAKAEAVQSRRLSRAAGIVVGVFALIVGGLWMTQTAEPEPAPASSRPADPLAARRQAAPAEDAQPATAAPRPDAERPFMDAADKGSAAYASGDHNTALARFEDAVRQNPDDAESLSNLAQVLIRLNRTAEAVPYLEKATALDARRWTYRFNLARAFGLLQRWDESIASYRQAQTLFPDDYATTFNLALALHKKGDDAAAIEEYKKAIALNPSEASFRMALAISYEATQHKQEAAAQYSEYLRLSPLAADGEKVRTRIAQLTGQPAPATPGN
jgi:tetratricopeptide (TPR) repeat protein